MVQQLRLDVAATTDNFDEADYLEANPDVARVVAAGGLVSGYAHFQHFGSAEGRKLRLSSHIDKMRAAKMRKVGRILRTDMPCLQRGLKRDYLSDALRASARIIDTDAVSAHPYDSYAEDLIGEFPNGIVADCGAGRRPTYYSNVVNVEIVDYDSTDVIAVGEALPFKTGSVDAVISVAVLEHVRDPFRCAAEIVRVLKPGGKLLCVVPFLQPEHGYPHHYYNMAPQGLRALFDDGLCVDDHKVVESTLPVWTLTWLLKSWSAGLSGPALSAFRQLTVGQLADSEPPQLLSQSWVADLSTAKNFELASATVLFAHKPGIPKKT